MALRVPPHDRRWNAVLSLKRIVESSKRCKPRVKCQLDDRRRSFDYGTSGAFEPELIGDLPRSAPQSLFKNPSKMPRAQSELTREPFFSRFRKLALANQSNGTRDNRFLSVPCRRSWNRVRTAAFACAITRILRVTRRSEKNEVLRLRARRTDRPTKDTGCFHSDEKPSVVIRIASGECFEILCARLQNHEPQSKRFATDALAVFGHAPRRRSRSLPNEPFRTVYRA